MTSQIEKNKNQTEKSKLNMSADDLKKQIAAEKLLDLGSKIPESSKSENITNINKNTSSTDEDMHDELDNIYISALENSNNKLENSKGNSDNSKKIGNNDNNIYNTDDGFVSDEEAADIKLLADAKRAESNNKIMDMLPKWLQNIVG